MSFSLSQWVRIFRQGKPVYTTADLCKLTGYSLSSVRKILARLVERDILSQIKRELYANQLKPPSFEQVACLIYPPAYISCESILFEEGILEQSPYTLTCVTLNKTKKVDFKRGSVFFQKIKKELYFGFYSHQGAYFADPEKALCDYCYLKLKNGEKISIEDWNLESLKPKKLRQYLKPYPRSVKTILEEILSKNHFAI